MVITEGEFDASVLSRLMPWLDEEETDFTKGARGPLRLGGSGKDDFRLRGAIELHEGNNPHYHIWAQGWVVDEGVTPKTEWPTLKKFFVTVCAGLKQPDIVATRVLAEYRYPRDWWRFPMKLPIPLPSAPGETPPDAEITGLELTYVSDDGTERVLVSTEGDGFQVFVSFVTTGTVASDMFTAVLQRSAAIGGRLFNQGTRQAEDA